MEQTGQNAYFAMFQIVRCR